MRQNWFTEEGYLVCAEVENLPLTFLLDTGSNVTILRRDVIDQFSVDDCPIIEPTNINLLTVTEETTLFLGKATVSIKIGSQTFKHPVLFANIENPGIIGMDFLLAHKCDLMLSQQCIKINGEKIMCFLNSSNAAPRCCKVAIQEHVEIPANCEMIVEGVPLGPIHIDTTGLIEAHSLFMQRKGAIVANALVSPPNRHGTCALS